MEGWACEGLVVLLDVALDTEGPVELEPLLAPGADERPSRSVP